jgi:hypothetical protein
MNRPQDDDDSDNHAIKTPLRVPLHQMDSVQRSIAREVFNLDTARKERDRAYMDREFEDQNAWRHDSERQQQDYHQPDALNPSSSRFNIDAARAARRAAYEVYDREQEDAWRHDACNLWSQDARRNPR